MIVGVAVRFFHNNAEIEVRLPKPNRHSDCFKYAADVLNLPFDSHKGADNQGFYNCAGTYLNREKAMRHARRMKQELIPMSDGQLNKSKRLFSEDVW